jgi:dTDP-4-dehydrorhamnose reductase
MARVLITGGGGMLAQAVSQAFGANHSIHALDRSRLDITDASAVRQTILEISPHVVVNCAAFTRVDECEKEEETAVRVNGIAVGYLAAALPESTLLVHISTDFVFPGRKSTPYREENPTDPISNYGRSKRLGEKAVQSRRGPWLLVRTSWLYGAGGRNFVQSIRDKAGRGDDIQVVNDQCGSPTWTVDLAGALLHLVEGGHTGTFHAAGEGETTWYEFARAIVSAIGADVEVAPIQSSDLDRPAPRPARSTLHCGKLSATGHSMRPWRDALHAYLGREEGAWAPREQTS